MLRGNQLKSAHQTSIRFRKVYEQIKSTVYYSTKIYIINKVYISLIYGVMMMLSSPAAVVPSPSKSAAKTTQVSTKELANVLKILI